MFQIYTSAEATDEEDEQLAFVWVAFMIGPDEERDGTISDSYNTGQEVEGHYVVHKLNKGGPTGPSLDYTGYPYDVE
jgi:hypothetical protein